MQDVPRPLVQSSLHLDSAPLLFLGGGSRRRRRHSFDLTQRNQQIPAGLGEGVRGARCRDALNLVRTAVDSKN